MLRALGDLQPGLRASGITGFLTVTKSGTTARTVTFPDAAITVARTDAAQTFTGVQTFSSPPSSTVSTGTAPFTVASTTAVANLNCSLLLGATWVAPGAIGSTTPSTGAFTTLSQAGGNYHYLRGDASTDGSVRISSQAAGATSIEKRASGSWSTVVSFT